MAERPLYTLYKNLKAQNYDVPDDYNKFESALTRDGKGGADNRHAIYENLKAQNFDVPNTYERFYSALFEPRSKTSSRAKGGSVPMSAADRARFSAGAAAISASAQHTMNNAGRYNRLKQRKQKQQKDFGRVNLGTHQTPYGGDSNNVVKDDFSYNPETGKAGAYVSSDNENVYSQPEAEQKQAVLDQQNNAYQEAVDTGEIPSVFDVRDKNGNYDLQENINKNGTYLTEEGARNQFDKKLADAYARKKEIEAAIAEDHRLHGNPLLSYGASIGASNGRTAEQSDYSNKLATSLALVKQQIGALEAVKQYPISSWGEDALKALDNTAFTAKTWDFGLTDFATMGQMERIKTKMDNNLPLSGSDKMLLKSKLGADAAAALEDEKMGNIYRWTKIAGQSLPFMADFFLTGGYGGITKTISRGALKYAAKRGMGKVSAAILKNTGIVAGDVIGSYAMAGSEQAMKTGADIMQRHLGSLYQDEKGDYKFGTFDENGNLLHEGGESMGTALYKGLTSAMVENYIEKLFGHSYGIKKGAINFMEKHGMNASAEFFKNIGKSGWYTNSKKWMEKFGINGFGEEVMEEEIGIPLHALLDGDNKFSDLLDTKQQLDIIGGMALSVGSMYAMGAGSRPAKGVYNRAQYYRFRNKVNVADSDAQNLMGDKWADIKDKIDNSTNEQMGGVLADILRQRDTMSKEQINAAINYGINLMKMRGNNVAKTAEMNAREITNEPTTPEEQHQEDIDNAYSEGHDADDADKHDIQLEHEDQMKTLAAALNISEQQLSAMNDDELQSLTGQNDKLDQAIYDYQLSSARYQGVTDDAQDKIDMAANQAAQRVDMYTDKSRGSVRNATVKASGGAEDYGVYIISGNIATNEDGSINVADSDDMILFYDPTTNSVEHADALRFAELGDEVPADDVKAQAVADAKEKAIKEVAGIVDGTIDVGSQFKVTGADGLEHTYEILADYGDGTAAISIDGNVVENPYSLEDLQQLKDLEDQKRLEAAKTQREQMEKERADQTQETELPEETQPSLDFNQILNDNGNVVLADVLGKDGNTKYPNSQLFLIRDSGAKAKVVELTSDGSLIPHAVNKKDVRTATTMTLDEYKQAFAGSSMIEDNSGTIEGDRGGIEVEDNAQPLSETDADNVIAQMESNAEVAPELELTPDNWAAEFGEDGIVSTPIGDVKMGENQVAKLFEKGRSKEFGMIKPTLTNPDVIIEVPSHSADGNEERSSSYLFIKTFLGKNGEKVYYFKSVTIKKDGLEISISSHYDRAKRVKEALMKGKLLYRKNDGAQTEQNQPSTSVTTSQEDAAGSSESKDTNISANSNENNESLTFEDGTPIPVDESGETDLSQTDAAHAAEWYDNNLGEDADVWLDGEIKKAKKVLEQAKNRKLTGTKPSELVASKKEKEAAIADAQAHYDSAISIRDSLKERRIAKEENTVEGRKNLIEKARRKFARLKSAVNNDAEAVSQLYKDVVGSLLHRLYDGTGIDVTDTIPLTAEEYVASNLGAHSLNYEGTETSKGVKQETGLSREDFAKTQLLAADGKGTTIDDLVHSLWENRPSNLESLDTQDIRNALIDVLTSGFKASEARNYIENLRIAQAENILEEQKKAADNAAFAEEQNAPAEQQTETAPESEEKTGEENSDEINDEENENINEQTNENINEQTKFPDKLREGSKAIEVPEDATDDAPLGKPLDESDLRFSSKGNDTQQTITDSDVDVEKNKVDDVKVVDNIVGKKTRKTLEKIAKIMGANIQWLYSNNQFNGRFDEKTNTIYLTLDSSITEGVQFIFGHEMTHEMRTKNPAAYDELKTLVKDMMGEDVFSAETDKMQQRYKKCGARYWNNRNAIEEEVVADQLGVWIRDANYAHTLLLKMSHPLLARLHEIVNRFLMALRGIEISDDMNLILRSIEQAYVKTAKGEITNPETGEDVSFSLRQKPEPKKKGIGYKVFVLKDGKLYPPMVANPDGAETPVGVWLDADAAPIAGESKTGRPQVKQGGKGTQGGSGKLAYRPGWHLGVVPYAIQFNRKDAEGNKTLFPKNFVFAEVEYAADVDYQEEARQEGINPSGKYQHSLAGLKHLPTDGYYMYRTNPNPETDPWVITGAMKVNRILTRAEQAELVKNAGREPQQIQEGDIVTDDVVNSINQEIANAPKFSLKVYHGSGADFTEFDFDHMGEGEGTQSFGWGGYVTSSPEIGKYYAESGRKDKYFVYNGEKLDWRHMSATLSDIVGMDGVSKADNFLMNVDRMGVDKAKQKLKNSIKENQEIYKEDNNDFYKKQIDVMQKLLDLDLSVETPKTSLYEVNIPDDNGRNYLDWDAPITDELIDKVAKALPSLRSFDIKDLKKDRTFENLYKTISMRSVMDDATFNDDKAASKLLSSLGYTGIKYKAGRNFGGAEVGDTNYVIFKPEDMRITEHTKFSLKDIKPVGKNKFGDVYDQFKGKPKEAFDFLLENKDGYLKGVFHRDEIGDIDLGYGEAPTPYTGYGLAHIIRKHVELMNDFDSVDDAVNAIIDVISNGKVEPINKDRVYEINKDIYRVAIAKDENGNWVLSAMDKSRSKKQKLREKSKKGAATVVPPSLPSDGAGAVAPNLSAAKIDNSSETAKENGEKFSLKDEKIKSVAEKFGVNEDDVAMYANAVERGSTAEAARARANIKRYLLQANEDKISSFKDIIKYTKPINEALKENFGDLDAMIEERRKQVEAQRNAMEAARKRAQEEEEKRQKHLDELSLIPTDELDKRYMDAIANNDESTAREMLDESARRNGYGDVDSDYQGQGAWAAPSNPQYESDEARRADIENSPDVNLEDIALGYNLQPDDYFDNPRAYMNNTAYGLESAHVIKNALDAIKNGEKDVKVKVYRAVPTSVKEGKLRNGDWVTPSKKYAEMHGDNRLEGKYRIIEDEVPANQLWWDGNDANEFGFDDGKEYRYKNAKNNRKLNDLITYDNKGNVIPPSKRFNSRKNDIRFSLAGERGAAAADKAEERTIRMDNLSVARKMEEEKKDSKAIKMATGWERGADGKWRYEMPDAMIKDTMDVGGGHIVKRYEDDMLWNGGKLSDVIDAPELFKAYPHLKDVRIETDAIMNDMPSNGEYNAKTNTITIHADELKYMNSILNHEIQHAIQSVEGFAKGGSPRLIRGEVKKKLNEVTKQIRQLRAEGKEDEAKALVEKNRGLYNAYQKNDDYNSYKSLAGEVEARNVSARLNMIPEERRKSLAESTEDVARKDQIFLGVGDVSFSLRDMADGKENGAADMAEELKSLNTPDEVDDAIKTAIEDMPSGWKMANKKMIHVAQALGENRKAEIAGEEPKFSLKDGSLIKAGTYFSGGGLVEEGLKGIIDPVVAVEYDEKISGVYRNNFGQHIVTADVRDVDPKELIKQIDGEVEYFHASPVCKNYSQAKSNHAEVELDKETAASTAEFINAVKPKVVTIENVKEYKDSEAMKAITDALDANGYTWDADVYNAADYGGYTNRERLIVRAVRDGKLPAKPKKMAHKSGWYEAVADIIPTLTEKKNGVVPWMDIRLKADGIDWRNIDKPLYVMGSAYADGKVPHAFADELLPTLRTKSGDVIVMPDGKVYRAMGRVLARVSGVSDDYKMPFSENLSHTIIGNGIPTQLTEHVIAPLLQNTLRPTTHEDGNTRFSLRYDQFEHDLNQWKKDNNLPKDAQRPTIPQRNAGESAVDFLRRVDEYRKQMALWKTAPTYEQHLLSDDTALGEFNRELQRGSVLKRIAFQDSMLAIRKAQEAIMKEVGVDRLNMAEDAYTAENRSHGKGKNEFEEYNNEFLQPLRKAYHQMKKVLGDSYDNVRVYMMAKHGLERDAQMAFKKSLEADYEDVNQRSAAYKAYKNDLDRVSNDADLEFGRVDFTTWRQKDNALRGKYSPSYMDYRYDDNGIANDYSGLSSLFDGSDFEEAAHKLVRDVETKHLAEVQALWNATNAATKKILRDGFKAGMMSKDAYEYVKGMYSHYIPLRGWDGTTADQVWDYIGGGKGAFNQILKTAHGRTSIADDPIAYIENMAESGILLNNKNWVKQHLMLLAQNHPTSLLTLSKAWYVKSTDANGNEEWIPATPQITSQMNSNQVKAAIDAFEQKMEQMAQTGDATQQRDGLNIAYPQTHSEEREHEVRVMKDGEEYVIYVNGDPQLAQAMNNTRAHRVREIQSGKLDRAAAWLGRKMAAAYTSLSPLFIPSNYFRDLTMTLASTAIREDGRYNYLLRKNLATSWNLGFMMRDYQNGKLREKVSNGNATPKEQMFYDFMMNGGETGFVSSLDVEDLKKKFKNDLKDLDRWKANPVKVGHTIMDGIEFLNRAIEDSNRFAVYMTSIQYGRSIDEAVNDAKDVTLNFNRKGTGEYGWQMIRNLYLFINPAVQSLQTLGALVKHHPFKFTAVTAAWLASGVLVPIVNAALMSLLGGDDDKDKYWQFSKWDRRNNAIMWIPFTNEYVKIPLAQEFRAFYGIGDMIASKMMGGELAEETWNQYAEDLLGQVVDMLPLDPTGYDGNIAVSLMPNAIRPVFELAFNVDFTGKPLFKDTEYNKYDPNFTKAYVGTPDWLVRVSKMVNSIGNDYPDVQQNAIDAFGDPRYNLNNPAVVDHVLSSYLGGAYTMGSQVLGVLTKSLNDPKEIKMADIPLVSKFVSNPDDRPVTKKQGDEFWNMKENHDRAANTLSKLKKQAKVDGDYTLLEQFYGSEEYKQYKQEDVKVKKYEEDKKKERAEESGEEYRPHKLNAEDIYKAHATPQDDFEDLKLKQLFTKLNGFKTSYDLLVDTAPSQSDGYYNTNKVAIDAIDEISLDKQEISELKKGFLEDGKDAYNAEDMKRIRELRKRILSVLEPANKVVVARQKAKAEKK